MNYELNMDSVHTLMHNSCSKLQEKGELHNAKCVVQLLKGYQCLQFESYSVLPFYDL